jgi:hypothetical protein
MEQEPVNEPDETQGRSDRHQSCFFRQQKSLFSYAVMYNNSWQDGHQSSFFNDTKKSYSNM